jgi:hypothetical protein
VKLKRGSGYFKVLRARSLEPRLQARGFWMNHLSERQNDLLLDPAAALEQ